MSDSTIHVTGMTCAACSARIQRSLEKSPGVTAATVNLMTNSATVAYDPVRTSPGDLLNVIRETGYGAELPAPDLTIEAELDQEDRERDAELRRLRRKVGFGLVAAVLTMVLSMPLMDSAHGVPDPFMRVMMWLSTPLRQLLPGLFSLSPDLLRVLLLGLTLPVVTWAGRQFYVRAWVAARHRAVDMNTLIALGTGVALAFSLRDHILAGMVPRTRPHPRGVLRSSCVDCRPPPAGQLVRDQRHAPDRCCRAPPRRPSPRVRYPYHGNHRGGGPHRLGASGG